MLQAFESSLYSVAVTGVAFALPGRRKCLIGIAGYRRYDGLTGLEPGAPVRGRRTTADRPELPGMPARSA